MCLTVITLTQTAIIWRLVASHQMTQMVNTLKLWATSCCCNYYQSVSDSNKHYGHPLDNQQLFPRCKEAVSTEL